MSDGESGQQDHAVRVKLGNEQLVISNKYETMSIANDVLIAVFFLAGSIMFYFESLHAVATTMFVLGSVDFLLRPLIRVARRVHLQRLDGQGQADLHDDY